MKCVKNADTVRRVSDEEAERLVATGKWQYCPKDDWRKAGKPRS